MNYWRPSLLPAEDATISIFRLGPAAASAISLAKIVFPVKNGLSGRRPAKPQPFVRTSENLILQALRREDQYIEMRLIECLGLAREAEVSFFLPHHGAALTNLRGQNPQSLAGGPVYRFRVRPQQIITIRFQAGSRVEAIQPVTEWDRFVPLAKRPALHQYGNYKGHPHRSGP